MGLFPDDFVVVPAEARDTDSEVVSVALEWASSDPHVVEASSLGPRNGRLAAVAPGEATVTVSAGATSVDIAVSVGAVLEGENILASAVSSHPWAEEPILAAGSGGVLYAGWKEGFGNPPGNPARVIFSRSSDGGRSWSVATPMPTVSDLSDAEVIRSDPWLVEDRGSLVYSWLEHDDAGRRAVGVARSEDGGATWSAPSSALAFEGAPDKSVLAGDGAGTLYVIYGLEGDDRESVVVVRSLDDAATWTDPVRVTEAEGALFLPMIAALPGGIACAFWGDNSDFPLFGDPYALMTACSMDGGVTWEPERVLDVAPDLGPGYQRQGGPHAITDGVGTFFVAWIADGPNFVVARSDDGGRSWSEPVAVNDGPNGLRWQPTLALASDGTLHATWYDTRSGDIHVAYAYSEDGGLTWSRDARVTTGGTPPNLTPVGPPTSEGTRLGDYMGLVATADAVVVLFTDWRGVDQDIRSARIPR
ncbi:MAG: Ig-like domain-containing protein [Gemmatimonadota bacterium]|nr:Ig-like domain-containing protein [Gemmatimonadota bacterium]